MLLAVDVDDVWTHLGVFADGDRAPPGHWRLETVHDAAHEDLRSALAGLLSQCRLSPARIGRSVVCSAVPRLSREWSAVARLHLGHLMIEAGPSLSGAGMLTRRDGTGDVSAHRLANALAAYDRVRGACVIVDAGTVITCDVVSASGAYLGGVVMPRAEAALAALCERTSLLPRVELTASPSPIGRSTADALRSGTVYGFAGQVEAIVRRLRHEAGGRARVIATGATAPAVASLTRQTIDEVDDLLTLRGLRLIAEANASRAST